MQMYLKSLPFLKSFYLIMEIVSSFIISFVLSLCTAAEIEKQFICIDGRTPTINIKKTCDGVKDCDDGSDEVSSLCRQIM